MIILISRSISAQYFERSETYYRYKIVSYIDSFFSNVSLAKKKRAIDLIPEILRVGKKYNVCPIMITITISHESSFKSDVVGAIGEIGLMQVHGVAAKGFNLKKVRDQLEAGTRTLKMGLQRCDDVQEVFNYYMTGNCNVATGGSKRRYKIYQNWK